MITITEDLAWDAYAAFQRAEHWFHECKIHELAVGVHGPTWVEYELVKNANAARGLCTAMGLKNPLADWFGIAS